MIEKYLNRRAEMLRSLDGLRVEIDAGRRIGYLILDRPPLNIVSYQARTQIRLIIEEMDEDDDIGVIVIRGANGVYTSGGDVKGFLDIPPDGMSHLAWNIGAPERASKPVIAAIEKYAMGVGFELSLACDFRIATRDSVIALPESTIGQMPGSGGAPRIVKMIGLTRAKHMVLLGERLPAQKALEWGILTEVVEDGEALTAAIHKYAERLNALAPISRSTLKRVLNLAQDTSNAAGLDLEGHGYEKLRGTADYREGIHAFADKRRAKYQGK